jgi:hypothetical protein
LVFLLDFDEVALGAEFRGLPQAHLIWPGLFLSLWKCTPVWVFFALLL